MKRFVIALAVLAALPFGPTAPANAGGGGCYGGYTPDAAAVAVSIQEMCMDPLVVRVKAGQTVTWTNNDQMRHNVLGSGMRWGRYEELGRGEQVAFTFTAPGTFPYACTLHPGMIGAVVVGNGIPRAGATPDDATVREAQVPAQRAAQSSSQAASLPEPAAEPTTAEAPAAEVPASEPATSEAAAVAPVSTGPSPEADRAVDLARASKTTTDRSGALVAGLAGLAALVLAAVAALARRTPRTRELVG